MGARKRLLKRLGLRFGLVAPYQSKRSGGAEERWDLIRAELTADDRSVLDIGSNIGLMTELASGGGRFTIGVEPDPRLVRVARRRTRDAESLAFVRAGIDPESVLALPEVDVVLCLSVHHYWVARFGEDAAWRIIGALLARSRRKFFFEPASVKRKYGGVDLEFEDLDRDAIVEYNVKHLEAVAERGQSIRVLGETHCRPSEPFRMLFLVERSATPERT